MSQRRISSWTLEKFVDEKSDIPGALEAESL